MQLALGKVNEVKFKVGVNGTQQAPTVRLVLTTPKSELGFPASAMGDGFWFSEVKLPEELDVGTYKMRVEVVLNNRLFTPLNRPIEIGHEAPMMAATPTTSAVDDTVAETAPAGSTTASSPATPTQKPKQTQDWEGEGGALPEVPEKPVPLPQAPNPAKRPSLFKEASKAAEKPNSKEPPKRVYAVKTDMPTSRGKAAPIKIKISEIAADSSRKFDADLKESGSYRQPLAAAQPIIIKQQTPVKLTKGGVVYE